MRHPRIIIAGIGLAAVAAIGGITAASAASSPASGAHPAGQNAAPTVRTRAAAVAGKTETILVNAQGLPLYYYRPDTATKSFVTGGLARLWPPLTSAAPSAAGVSGKLTVLSDANRRQANQTFHCTPPSCGHCRPAFCQTPRYSCSFSRFASSSVLAKPSTTRPCSMT